MWICVFSRTGIKCDCGCLACPMCHFNDLSSHFRVQIAAYICLHLLPPLPLPPPFPPLMELNGILIFIVFVADVSGGFSPSILDAIRNTLDVSIHISFEKDEDYVPLTFREAFYLATLGGAKGVVNYAAVI